MKLGRSIRWAVILGGMSVLLFSGIQVLGTEPVKPDLSRQRADIIHIDGMKSFGPLERPAVAFLHDAHTDALEKLKKDCNACHLEKDGRLSLKFMRFEDTDRQTVMDIYHQNCIDCHKETAAKGAKSGPVECGQCHEEKAQFTSIRKPPKFDKSLHYRHVRARDNKCEQCHHEYDPVAKKLYYAKGKEGSCLYCHGKVTVDNRIAMDQAAHIACIDCHRKTLAQNKIAGPVKCAGCHDPEAQALYEVVKNVPRMQRNQPDSVFVQKDKETTLAEQPTAIRMPRVPFNHKGHEQYTDTCIQCHHKDLTACSNCHTTTGAKEGNYVKLAQAMHQLKTKTSCLGCHQAKQSATQCAGCHASMPEGAESRPELCGICHIQLPEGLQMPGAKSDQDQLAQYMLQSRKPIMQTYAAADIPETVTIDKLTKQYEPVKFPHRKIVLALMKGIGEDKLAAYFHPDEGTLCQGCHHNAPATKTPPMCATCHGRPFNPQEPFRPGLMGAYHQQCMGCHKTMGIKKPMGCTECHKEKSVSLTSSN